MTNRYGVGRVHNKTRTNLGKTRRKFPARFAFFAKYAPKPAGYAKSALFCPGSATIEATQRQTPV
ncbi:MAG: hypothetical protein UF620_12955 [Gemmiger sp.]|nr:hypothetical protein [Gemmiger sp.]